MTDGPKEILERAGTVQKSGAELRSATIDQRTDWLANAASILDGRAREGASALSESTGLSEPMVTWAARTTFGTIRKEAMTTLVREAGPGGEPLGMLAVVLAGNVFTAVIRAAFVPLLFGVPVLLKASSRETLFPRMMRDALRDADPRLGGSIDVVVFEGGDRDAETALVETADAVSVYGSDQTVEAMRGRLPNAALMAHGHGVSAAYCGADALGDDAIEGTVWQLALDVCAYDQRGCLSPQVIFVEPSASRSALEFARYLVEHGLRPMGEELPRGPLPPAVGAAQAQWRGLAEVEGTLLSGPDHAVAIRAATPIRWSPGYRNVTISPTAGLQEAFEVITPLGNHLKCIGADPSSLHEVQRRLDESNALGAHACQLGDMQTPPLDAPSDGRPIWAGLRRR